LGKMTLYRVPLFTSGQPQVLAFAGIAGFPVVASRRNRLVYSRFRIELHIWRAEGGTSAPHPVSSTESERAARFSPDGKRKDFEPARVARQLAPAITDAVVQAPEFQRLQRTWRGLQSLVNRTEPSK